MGKICFPLQTEALVTQICSFSRAEWSHEFMKLVSTYASQPSLGARCASAFMLAEGHDDRGAKLADLYFSYRLFQSCAGFEVAESICHTRPCEVSHLCGVPQFGGEKQTGMSSRVAGSGETTTALSVVKTVDDARLPRDARPSGTHAHARFDVAESFGETRQLEFSHHCAVSQFDVGRVHFDGQHYF